MSKTKSEKLIEQVGVKTECDFCHRIIPFRRNWMMTADKSIVCPGCQEKAAKAGNLLVSI